MQNATVVNPLGIDVFDTSGYAPLHEVRDEDKLDAIADDMRRRGWHGPPLVVMRDNLSSLTGVHRRAAAELAELEEIPGVELADLFEACGLDMWEIVVGDESLDDEVAHNDFRRLLDYLPEDVREAYGLDMH
ncbi:ParB N-terminal domain-containing protein [Thermoactinospora rubra]|uniref:ParB N-terminal domain-containing protein n=1 Tax=Thermoactinospora rubra TaxID=1088767 RepID=UPI001301C269|nr:ParB N-terminal domain-containing protein [Thermoactinospora rubra]